MKQLPQIGKPDEFLTPEIRELWKKQAELASLENELIQRELELATLRLDLQAFETQYLRIVGVKCAELDALEAEIAECFARLYPDNVEARSRANVARAAADESARAGTQSDARQSDEYVPPSESLKALYRQIAKLVHPDLAASDSERKRREKVMADVNVAFDAGDEARLREILREWHESPESIEGSGPGVELVRVIRQIAQVTNRLPAIASAMEELKRTPIFELRIKVSHAQQEGRDLLAEMAATMDERIEGARERIGALRGSSRP